MCTVAIFGLVIGIIWGIIDYCQRDKDQYDPYKNIPYDKKTGLYKGERRPGQYADNYEYYGDHRFRD